MIYQLVRRDEAWRAAPWVAIGNAMVWAWAPQQMGQFGVMVATMGLFAGAPQRHASRLQAGLPIAGRDLSLARAISLMALVWMPALAAAAALLARGGSGAVKPLEVASLCMLMVGIVQSISRKELAAPGWTLLPLLALLAASAGLMSEHPAPRVALVCALAGIGLMARCLVAAPRSYHVGAEHAADPRSEGRAERRVLAWAPVMRSVYSWQYVLFVGMIGTQAIGGEWWLSSFWLMMVWAGVRQQMRWLWALPAGRRALLWTILGPILAVQVGGYLLGAHFYRHRGAGTDLFGLTAMIAWALVWVLPMVLADWRGFAQVPRPIHDAVVRAVLVIWMVGNVAALCLTSFRSTWPNDALERIGQSSSVGQIAVLAALVVALYCAVEKAFCEPDFADKSRAEQADAMA